MAKAHKCDVPGCPHTRRRWQRLCERCFAALPGDIRTGILESHRAGRKPDWRRECKRAADHLAPVLNPLTLSPSKGDRPRDTEAERQAYARQQRLLGEHD